MPDIKLLMVVSQVALVVKNLPANSGDRGEVGSVSELGRSPGEGHGNPLQYYCLENPMDWGAWQAVVHGVPKSQTWLSTHTYGKPIMPCCYLHHSSFSYDRLFFLSFGKIYYPSLGKLFSFSCPPTPTHVLGWAAMFLCDFTLLVTVDWSKVDT